jgi:hypothetical protein
MRVVVTGATGLIGRALVERLRARGDEVIALSRDARRASATLGVQAAAWDPAREPAPPDALAGADAIAHLAGASVARRWTDAAKREIRDSRLHGTANLVAGLRTADPRPAVLVSASAIGYYGPHGDEPVDESAPAGGDFLAELCVGWEQAALAAATAGARVVILRTGVILDRHGGALKKMLPPFQVGLGGPIASGRQYVPWITLDDVVGLYLAALDDARFDGPFNATAPTPVTNRELSKALGRALHRPALLPVPAIALRALYGDMAEIVTTGVNAKPVHALELGHRFAHLDLDAGLRAALR